jgi:hypothetical protein
MPSPKKTTTQLTGSKSHPETAQKPPPTTSARQVSTCSTWPNSDLGSHLNRVVKRTAHFSTSKLPFRCYRHQCSNISVVMSFQKWHRASPALPARKRSSTSLFFTIIWHPPPTIEATGVFVEDKGLDDSSNHLQRRLNELVITRIQNNLQQSGVTRGCEPHQRSVSRSNTLTK